MGREEIRRPDKKGNLQMKKELDDKLCHRFPKLYEQRNWPATKTCMCWGFPGDGWFDLIWELSEKLEQIDPDIRAVQVKEKFGTLRFYIDGCSGETFKVAYAEISEAESRSAKTCEDCGKPGKLRGSGWYRTLCDDCEGKR